MHLGEWIDNELLYADIKWCLFGQNTPAELLYAVTDSVLAQQQNICVPGATEAALKTHCMHKGHHSSAQQNCDSKADAVHFCLPFAAPYWCFVPFPSVTGPSGQHQWSEQDVPHVCRTLSCTALMERSCFASHTTVADPEQGRVGRRPASTCPEPC